MLNDIQTKVRLELQAGPFVVFDENKILVQVLFAKVIESVKQDFGRSVSIALRD
ncbi:hypothetical protein [Maridesulfovibrio sp.]|uniref:hypothetical protein n=1 Tax=unclassified Maridesulfovibrio TaxID=2794999 RepID=UPI003B00302D